jgi:hypothetical protein
VQQLQINTTFMNSLEAEGWDYEALTALDEGVVLFSSLPSPPPSLSPPLSHPPLTSPSCSSLPPARCGEGSGRSPGLVDQPVPILHIRQVKVGQYPGRIVTHSKGW